MNSIEPHKKERFALIWRYLRLKKPFQKGGGSLSDEIGPLSKLSFIFSKLLIRVAGVDCRSN